MLRWCVVLHGGVGVLGANGMLRWRVVRGCISAGAVMLLYDRVWWREGVSPGGARV